MNKIQINLTVALSVISACAVGDIEIQSAIEILMPTDTNTTYQIQTSSNLVNWVDSGSPFNGSGETNSHLFSTRAESSKFFRVLETSPAIVTDIDIPSYANLCGQWEYLQTGGYDTNWTRKVMGTTVENDLPVYLVQEFDQDGNYDDQEFLFSAEPFSVGVSASLQEGFEANLLIGELDGVSNFYEVLIKFFINYRW